MNKRMGIMNNGSSVCQKCKRPSVTFIRYSGAHLCREHFIEFFMKRVKREIRQQEAFQGGGRIAVAVSGGKDSLVTLKTLGEIANEHRGVDVEAIIVDEGIKGYRPESMKIARDACRDWGVKLHEITFKELAGFPLDDLVPEVTDINPCALCGVFRRSGLNEAAKKIGADKLATGHNLDDIAQSILMNVLNSDMEKLFRLGPHKNTIPGLIPRFYPLRSIPEKEVLLYALLNEIPIHSKECPYSVTATRGRYRDVLARLEMGSPGTKHSLLTFHSTLMDLTDKARPKGEQGMCEICNEPATSNVCMRCNYKRHIEKILETAR